MNRPHDFPIPDIEPIEPEHRESDLDIAVWIVLALVVQVFIAATCIVIGFNLGASS